MEELLTTRARLLGAQAGGGGDASADEAERSPLARSFSWVVKGVVAGGCLPGSHPSTLEADLSFLSAQGIKRVISLNEAPPETASLQAKGFSHLVLPVRDYYPPTIEQMEQMVKFVDEGSSDQGGTLIHCNAGMGRTGTMLAAYLIAKGMSAAEAIPKLRKERKGSIQTFKQEDSLTAFQEHLKTKSGD